MLSHNRLSSFLLTASLFFLLSACGSGQSQNNSLEYNGVTEPASLTSQNASVYINNIFSLDDYFGITPAFRSEKHVTSKKRSSVLDQIEKLGLQMKTTFKRLSLATNQARSDQLRLANRRVLDEFKVKEVEVCDEGSVNISGNLFQVIDGNTSEVHGEGELIFDYDHCVYNGEYTDGKLTLNIINSSPDFYDLYEMSFKFNTIEFGNSISSLLMSGNIWYLTENTAVEQNVSNLVVKQSNTNQLFKLVNFSVIKEIIGSVNFPEAISQTIQGRLYESHNGFIDISTARSILSEDTNQYQPEVIKPLPYSGILQFSGANNSSLTATLISSSFIKIQLDEDGDHEAEVDAIFRWTQLSGELSSDIADSDNDGMHDGWESYFGLNPSSADDAEQDLDSDGYSNVSEYQGNSNPDKTLSHPFRSDLFIDAYIGSGLYFYQADELFINEEFRLTYIIYNYGPDIAGYTKVKLHPPKGFTPESLENMENCSIQSSEPVDIVCEVLDFDVGAQKLFYFYYPPQQIEQEITYSAEAVSYSYDDYPEDNIFSATTSILKPYADLNITAFISPGIGAVIDTDFQYRLLIDNDGTTTAENIHVQLLLPSESRMVSSTNADWNCSAIAEIVDCYIDHLDPRGLNTVNTFNVTAPATSGLMTASVSLTTDSNEYDLTNNTASLEKLAAVSMQQIQDQIDLANSGDTVIVEPGIYLGSLDFQNREINLVSRNGADQTILIGSDVSYYLLDTSTGGSLQGFTIMGGPIMIKGTQPFVIKNNLFKGLGSDTNAVFAEGNLLIMDNLFTGYDDCWGWSFGVVHVYFADEVNLLNNQFISNACVAVVLSSGYNLTQVINNTFVDNGTAISLSQHDVATVSLTARNNLLVDNNYGFTVNNLHSEKLIWENNLTFNNSTEYTGIDDQSGINNNLNTDPLFIDAAGGNYQLQVSSPAIDTGSNQDAPLTDYNGSTRPVDGNGDSVPEYDIGAFEAPAL